MKKLFLIGAAALALSACETIFLDKPRQGDEAVSAADQLATVLAAQSEEAQARYQYRNPKETLAFFGVERGMTVVEALPGGRGWYSQILAPYLGPDGKLIGADYSVEMWKLFGGFANEEFLEKRETWAETWVTEAQEWAGDDSAELGAAVFGSISDDMAGSADVILVARALHHWNRFEDQGGYLTEALADMKTLLKPGGVVGVVQHRAPAGNSDEWANGDNGYVKQAQMITAFEAAGFEFVGASEINANPKDQPTEEDFVWRLPPTLGTSRDNEELRAQMLAIGETDRMTLKFRKP